MPDNGGRKSGERVAYAAAEVSIPGVAQFVERPTRRGFLTGVGAGLAGAFTACSQKRNSEGAITLWHIWALGQGGPIVQVLDRFAAVRPEIKVSSAQVSTNNLKAKLLAAAQSNSLPDVFLLNSAWVEDFGAGKQLIDLLPLAKADGLQPSSLLRALDYSRCCQGASMYCLPATSAHGALMLFTNHGLLPRKVNEPEQRFANWEEFTKASAEFVQELNAGRDLRIVALDPFMGPGMVIHSALAAGIGSPTTSADGRKSLLNTSGSLRAAHALDDFVQRVYGSFGGYRALLSWRFRFAGLHRVPIFSSLPYGRQVFALAAAGSLSSYLRLTPPPEVAVQPVPGLDHLHGGMASHGWAYAISAASSKKEAAWKLARFLTLEEDGVGRFCQAFCRPSPLAREDDAGYYQRVGRVWDSVKEVIKLDIPYPASPEDEYLRVLLYTVPMRRLRGESIEAIFADFHAQYQAYLDGART